MTEGLEYVTIGGKRYPVQQAGVDVVNTTPSELVAAPGAGKQVVLLLVALAHPTAREVAVSDGTSVLTLRAAGNQTATIGTGGYVVFAGAEGAAIQAASGTGAITSTIWVRYAILGIPNEPAGY